jgi:glycosyltransferase involved in cell wall biosynthesis
MSAHVCLISNRHWLYDGRVINQAHALAAAGYRVTIADLGRPAQWYRAASAEATAPSEFLPGNCAVVRIEDPTRDWPLVLQRLVRRQFRWWLRRSRVRQLAALGADVYQAPDLLTARYAVQVARAGAPMVYDIRDLYSAEWEGPARTRVRRRAVAQEGEALRRADVRLTVCDGLARLVSERYGLPAPVVVRNCRDPVPADAAGSDVRTMLGLAASTPLLVHSGHSGRGRGLSELLAVPGALPTLHLALVGQQEGLEAVGQATDPALRSRVHLLPSLPAPRVASFIRTADAAIIYLLPVSLNMRYALPNKFFEAVAAGLPLAISDGEEFRPLVQRYGIGVLFDPTQRAVAVDAVRAVLAARRQLRAAVESAREVLSWGRESRAYVDLYRDLVGAPR